jgi:hypothetical protein
MRAGLLDKRLSKDEMLPEDRGIFDMESHAAGDWLSRFQVSRLAKLGAGASLRTLADAGTQPGEVGLREYEKKNPAKRRRAGNDADLDESSERKAFGLPATGVMLSAR